MTDTVMHTDLITPDDPRYDQARQAWNLAVDQRPFAVALPRSADEVAGVVRAASAAGLRVAMQGTGHNAAPLGDLSGTVLVRTSAMRAVTVAPAAHLARVEAGALWADVVAAAAEHGLMPLAGSSHDVGAVGYSLGGGISWLARTHGLSANSVVAADVVTADGRQRQVNATHDPELFWALRGGGGNFAAVTALEIRLYPMPDVTAGALFFPLERASEVLKTWRRWVPGIPEEMTSCGRLLRFPPLPEIPDAMRGRSFAVLEIVHLAPARETDAMVAPLRALGPDMDTIAPATQADLLALHMDPPGPVPGTGDGMLLRALPAEAVDALLSVVGPGIDSPLQGVELRQLGGALGRPAEGAGALSHLDADVVLFAVGFTPDAASAARAAEELAHLGSAMAPWRAARDYLNYRETPDTAERFFPPDVLGRLRAVKQAYDPTNLFRANHPITS